MDEIEERTKILLVEDDKKLSSLVKEYLEQQGLDVTIEGRGDKANAAIEELKPDLVILDIMLPGMDGLTVCRNARPNYRGPIIMLTARGDDLDEVVGLEVGADDYMKKPASPRVLLARIHTLLRRVNAQPPAAPDKRLEVGPLVIDSGSRSVTMAGLEVELTTAEFDLLRLLAENAGEPISRDRIYQDLRGIDHDGLDRSIDLRISRLRTKLGKDGSDLIISVRGVGYQLVVAG
ncbi:MAG: response regulator [Kofleriaceae bacterium]|nr:response regulator [Kofleriaceae bacterium]